MTTDFHQIYMNCSEEESYISNFRTICVNHILGWLVTKYVDLTKINLYVFQSGLNFVNLKCQLVIIHLRPICQIWKTKATLEKGPVHIVYLTPPKHTFFSVLFVKAFALKIRHLSTLLPSYFCCKKLSFYLFIKKKLPTILCHLEFAKFNNDFWLFF